MPTKKPEGFLDPGVLASPLVGHDDEYKAALKAADAVYSKDDSPISCAENSPSPNAPVGRVLPSLVQEDDALIGRQDETARPPRRVGKAASSSPVRRNKPARLPKSKIAEAPVAQPTADPLLEDVSEERFKDDGF